MAIASNKTNPNGSLNGDPFDMTSYPVRVYGEGEILHEE